MLFEYFENSFRECVRVLMQEEFYDKKFIGISCLVKFNSNQIAGSTKNCIKLWDLF